MEMELTNELWAKRLEGLERDEANNRGRRGERERGVRRKSWPSRSRGLVVRGAGTRERERPMEEERESLEVAPIPAPAMGLRIRTLPLAIYL